MKKFDNGSVVGMEESNINKRGYYRDVPKEYSPVIASLILNKSVEKKTDISSMVLYFIKNSYLKKDVDNIVYTGKDLSGLSESDKYFIQSYTDKTFEFEKWRNLITEEAKDKGYFRRCIPVSIDVLKGIVLKIAIILSLSTIILINYVPEIIVAILFLSLILLLPLGVTVISIFACKENQINIRLTKKGVKEREKLIKLRKFLTDFTSLDISDDKWLMLLEDYLIYSISLGVNINIVEQSKIYEKMNCSKFNINKDLVFATCSDYK